MATNSLRRSVVRSFKLQGLTLQSSATSLLVEVLEPYQDDSDLEEIVDRIIEAVQKQPLTSSVVGREVMPLPPTLIVIPYFNTLISSLLPHSPLTPLLFPLPPSLLICLPHFYLFYLLRCISSRFLF